MNNTRCGFLSMLSVLVLVIALFGACAGNTAPDATVITKASVSYSLHTTTTTAAPTTATTLPLGGTGTGGDTVVTGGPTTLPTVGQSESGSELGRRIAETAIGLIGTPFKNGASGPDAFDNPGFVSYCYKQNGQTVARRASAMLNYGVEAPLDALQAGDILLFCNELGGEVQFAAIYIGGDRFVACNNPETPTKEQKLDKSYWLPRLVTARRAA